MAIVTKQELQKAITETADAVIQNQVDADRLPAYLESTNAANVPFYERNGFAVCGTAELPDGPSLTQLSRPAVHHSTPSKSSGGSTSVLTGSGAAGR